MKKDNAFKHFTLSMLQALMACEEETEKRKKDRDKAMKAYAACSQMTPDEMKLRALLLAIDAGHNTITDAAKILDLTEDETRRIAKIADDRDILGPGLYCDNGEKKPYHQRDCLHLSSGFSVFHIPKIEAFEEKPLITD